MFCKFGETRLVLVAERPCSFWVPVVKCFTYKITLMRFFRNRIMFRQFLFQQNGRLEMLFFPLEMAAMQNYVMHCDVRSWRASGVMFDKTHCIEN